MIDQEAISEYSRLSSEAAYAEAAIERQEAELEEFEERVKIAIEEIEFQKEHLYDTNNEITEVELEWEESHKCYCGLKGMESSCPHDKD